MKLWTCIARCSVCDKELKQVQDVPDDRRTKVIMKAPFISLCDVPEHNTFSDFNLRVRLQWIEQEAERPTPEHLTPKRTTSKQRRHGVKPARQRVQAV